MTATALKDKPAKVNKTLARALLDAGIEEGQTIYMIRSPLAGDEHWSARKGSSTLYGLKLTDGIAVTTDEPLARRIMAEFPGYELVEVGS